MASVSFFDEECGFSLWSTEGPVPCVGDTVSYVMQHCDKSQWDSEAWDEGMELHDKKWVVAKVHHEFRRYSPFELSHLVYVYLVPAADS